MSIRVEVTNLIFQDSAAWGQFPMAKLITDGSRQPHDRFQSKNAYSPSLNERNRTMYHDLGVKICGKRDLTFSVLHPAALKNLNLKKNKNKKIKK